MKVPNFHGRGVFAGPLIKIDAHAGVARCVLGIQGWYDLDCIEPRVLRQGFRHQLEAFCKFRYGILIQPAKQLPDSGIIPQASFNHISLLLKSHYPLKYNTFKIS